MTNTTKTSILILAALALVATACGGQDDNVSAGQAQKVTAVAWEAVSQAQTNIANGIDSAPASDANNAQADLVSGGGGSWTIDGTIQNPKGAGELVLKGSATSSGSGFSANVTGTFKGWASQGITLDGPLTLTFDIAKVLPLDISSTLKGTLDVAGLLPVSVPIGVDLTATVQGAQAGVCGSVAGQPVSIGSCQ